VNESGAFWVYVVENPAGTYYVGSTDNVGRRIEQHNSSADERKFTHKHGPWKLIWHEQHPSRSAAVVRERQIKSMKSARWIRDHLLNGRVPARRD